LVGGENSRGQTVSEWLEVLDARVNTETGLGDALDLMNESLASVVIFECDSNIRKFGFSRDFVRLEVALSLEQLDDFKLDLAVGNVDVIIFA